MNWNYEAYMCFLQMCVYVGGWYELGLYSLDECIYGWAVLVGLFSSDVCIWGRVVIVGAVFFRCVYMWVGGNSWGCILLMSVYVGGW